jgi:O-antigen/teichoic acid export membrane protein
MIKNSLIYIFGEVLNKAILFLLLPIFTKYLTPTDYGMIASFVSFVSFLSIFIGLSIHGAVNINFFKTSKEELRIYIANGLLLLLLTTLLIMFIVFVFQKPLSNKLLLDSEWLYIGVILSLAQFITLLNLTLWIAEKNSKAYSIYQILQTFIISSMSILFIVALHYDWKGQVIANLFSTLSFSLFSFYLLYKRGYLEFKYNKNDMKDLLHFGIPMIPHDLSGWITTSGDRLLLITMVGVSATGLFTVGFQIGMIMSVLVSSFHKVWSPYLYEKLSLTEVSIKSKIKIVKFTYLYFLSVFLLVLVLNFIAKYIFIYFIDIDYAESYRYVIYILITYGLNGAYFMVVGYIFYFKRTKQLAYITFSSSVLHLLLSYIFINLYGAIGVAYSGVLSYTFMFLSVWYYSNKIYPMPWIFWRYND